MKIDREEESDRREENQRIWRNRVGRPTETSEGGELEAGNSGYRWKVGQRSVKREDDD
jgi:hypothetical protein